jgi:hypothetical protein
MGHIVWGDHSLPYRVVGWFTPDYRSLAEGFSANCVEVNAPHHLFELDSLPDWCTHAKPVVLRSAMQRYPGHRIILMDVDCLLRGPIHALARSTADLSFYLNVKRREGERARGHASSRVMSIAPNAGVLEFLKSWDHWNAAISSKGDEQGLLAAFGQASNLLYQPLDILYAGRELEDAPDNAVIVHQSATQDTTGGRMRRWFKRSRRQAGITRRQAA